ncbi:MAG TPA: hydrogen gas-evolving membrane-bound hydrogenase subunit E, partial [Solirubrobacteraceae bacterium]|nr:hydrogen gas-evolving membrane-bound hydrogenase subunit E [Solirubrobacteraceae bacterium]
LRLSFRLDGLAALYSLLATGVGLVVFLYSRAYLPREGADRGASGTLRFYGWMTLFMVSMVGIATAQDMILLFVFWDLTAIASYFLIAQDREDRVARVAALTALLVTGVSAVLLLIGALLLFAEHGTFSLPQLFELARGGGTTTTAGVGLIVVAALAKSAQVPFHFWLPRAMRAPTPVSAYLHSAAMVAAGVLLIGRVYPLVVPSGLLMDGLLVVGFVSIAVGGALALTSDDMKQILAYSTFSQYGYVVVLYGLGGETGAVGAALYVASHAVCKCALFLVAGTVTEATGGQRRLSELGGLAASQPLLATAAGLAAAGIAGLPLTVGFLGDELFFGAAVEVGTAPALLTVGAATLTLAYIARFWSGVFLGPRPQGLPGTAATRAPLGLVLPPALLAALVLAGGVVPSLFSGLAAAAGEASLTGPASVSVAYHPDLRPENLMALSAYAGGALLFVVSGGALRPALERLSALGERIGPDRAYVAGMRGLNAGSDRIHRLEVRDLRGRVTAVLLPAGVLVVAALAASPTVGSYSVGELPTREIALALGLTLAALAGFAATRVRGHLTLMLSLAMVGYSLAGAYALFGAPDVALVAVLVETLFALLFLGVFALVPAEVLERERSVVTPRPRRRRNVVIAVVSGGLVFALVWGSLSSPVTGEPVVQRQIALAPEAHAKDVVTAILADFRGFDTLGEVTVVLVALAGVATLLRRGRLT